MHPKLLLALLALLAFGASLAHGFHFDDFSIANGPVWSWWQTRPLTTLTFWFNAAAESLVLWHAVSVGLHVAATLLLYALLAELLPRPAALIAAALFAVHPMQAEAVAYVFARATLLSTGLCLAALLFWVRERRWWAVGFFATALLAKEDCVALPLVIVLLGWWRGRLVPLGTMMLLSVVIGLRTLLATRFTPGSGAGFTSAITAIAYMTQEGAVILRYLRLLVWPFGFTIDPDLQVSLALGLAAWAIVVSLAFVAWRSGYMWVVAGLVLLLPSSSIFPASDLAADHRMYLPMIGFAAAAGVALQRIHVKAAALVIALLLLLSISRMTVWGSEEALWTEAVQASPAKVRPRIQLARAVGPERGLAVLEEALRLYPVDAQILAEEGRVYLQQGRFSEALSCFGKVLGQRPGDPHALNNRGVALQALGQNLAARKDFEAALRAQPCMFEARQNLGWTECRGSTGK